MSNYWTGMWSGLWTGLLDWTTGPGPLDLDYWTWTAGLDYWTGLLFGFLFHITSTQSDVQIWLPALCSYKLIPIHASECT